MPQVSAPNDSLLPLVTGLWGLGLILHFKRRRVLRPVLPAVIEAGGGNIGVSQPLLHLGNICLMIQGIGGGGGTKRMHPQAFDAGQPNLVGVGLHEFVDPVRGHAAA